MKFHLARKVSPLCRSSSLMVSGALLLTGCGRDQITSYQVPKETPAPIHHDELASAATPKLKYTLPEGWKEAPSESAMRAASFVVTGKDGHTANVAVIPIPGVAGRQAEIVNLWRTQAKLPPITAADLPQLLQPVEIGSRPGQLVEILSAEPLNEDKFKTRIVVAILELPAMSWYFKMTGEDELVASQKPEFTGFLKSVAFEMPTTAMMASASASGAAAASSPGLPQWKVPADWKSQAPGQMLLASFAITDASLGSATVTVSSFPGDVGGVLANVNRWRGQVGLAPIESPELDKATQTIEFDGLKAIVAEAPDRGTKSTGDKPARLIGAMVPHAGETWFFKLLGDDALAAKQRDAFLGFVKSISFDSPKPQFAPQTPVAPVAETGSTPSEPGLPAWQTPPHWQSQPPGQMLLATFAIDDAAAGKATLTVSSFPGDVGGLLANVNRWRAQTGLGAVETAALTKETTTLDVGAGKATLVDVTGPTKTSGGNNTRLLGALLPHDGQTWFFKMLGDEAAIAKEKQAFLTFLKSLKYANAR